MRMTALVAIASVVIRPEADIQRSMGVKAGHYLLGDWRQYLRQKRELLLADGIDLLPQQCIATHVLPQTKVVVLTLMFSVDEPLARKRGVLNKPLPVAHDCVMRDSRAVFR